MPEITLAGGVVIDVASRDDLAEHHRILAQALAHPPEEADFVPFFGSMVAPSGIGSGPLIIPITPAGPAEGSVFAIQALAIFAGSVANTPPDGATPVIASLNASFAIGRAPVGQGGGQPGTLPVTNPEDVKLPGLAVPTAGGVIVPGKILVRHKESMYCILRGSGLVVGVVYVATGSVLEARATRAANVYL